MTFIITSLSNKSISYCIRLFTFALGSSYHGDAFIYPVKCFYWPYFNWNSLLRGPDKQRLSRGRLPLTLPAPCTSPWKIAVMLHTFFFVFFVVCLFFSSEPFCPQNKRFHCGRDKTSPHSAEVQTQQTCPLRYGFISPCPSVTAWKVPKSPVTPTFAPTLANTPRLSPFRVLCEHRHTMTHNDRFNGVTRSLFGQKLHTHSTFSNYGVIRWGFFFSFFLSSCEICTSAVPGTILASLIVCLSVYSWREWSVWAHLWSLLERKRETWLHW